jgi:uncharacterized protein
MTLKSAIYSGWVMHSRRVPRPHRFRYRIWWLLIDLDELPHLDSSLHAFSRNKFNILSIHDGDCGLGSGDLRSYVEGRLSAAGLDHAGVRIELLTMPRQWGYAFNPLSIYFCRDCTDRVAAIIYEVHNTFGERHSYLVEAMEDRSGIVRQSARKQFYVSPFMDMAQDYSFRVRPPDARVAVSITASQGAEPVIYTALHGERRPLTSVSLLRHAVTHPLLNLKVIAAIHWEALRLWCRGIAVRPHQPISHHAVTSGNLERLRSSDG